MSHLWNRVMQFMLTFGQRVPLEDFHPQVPPDEVVRQRCKWLFEESVELIESCVSSYDQKKMAAAVSTIFDVIEIAELEVDLVAYADANADIRYVAYGNDIAAGIDSRETDAEVARSNDSKSPPEQPGGKVVKGPKYQPPQIAAILKEQGWNPEK